MGPQVIVVGAGLSGLSAAKWLREQNVEVLVLEARDRVGGRTYTKREAVTEYVDVGGSYVGPTQYHVLRMAKELGVETYPINEAEDAIFYDHGSRSRWQGGGWPPFWNPLAYLDVNHFFRTIDRLGKEIPQEAPWRASHADEWDKVTLQQFLDKTLYTATGRHLVHMFFSLLLASEPYEISLLWALTYIAQCGGSSRIFATTNGGQERKFKGGSQLLSDRMAEILSDRIVLKAPVVAISQKGRTVTVKILDGTEYTAEQVVLALSPSLQYRIQYDPPMPPLRNQLMQRMPMGSVIKASLFYRKAFWKEHGFCGSLLIAGHPDQHPMMYTLDDTKPDGSHPAITGFITADRCRRLITKSAQERKAVLCNSLAEVTRCPEALEPVHYEEFSWMSEEYSGGCYGGTCPPGLLTRYGSALRTPVGRLYMAGTETAAQWSGYMDGAISAGERAAREVLYDLGKLGRDQIWRQEPVVKENQGYEFELSFLERHLPSPQGAIAIVKVTLLLGILTTGVMTCFRRGPRPQELLLASLENVL